MHYSKYVRLGADRVDTTVPFEERLTGRGVNGFAFRTHDEVRQPERHRIKKFTISIAIAALVALAEVSAQEDSVGQNPSEATGVELPRDIARMFGQLPERLETWKPAGSDGGRAVQAFSFVGREDLAIQSDPDAFGFEACRALDSEPIPRLVVAARQAQIVIVNEAHHQPLHRYVIMQLGRALAADFEVFAAETFAHWTLAKREAGRVATSLGYYSGEPIFGREIRALDEAGYRFVAYEIRSHQGAPKGADHAEQIIAREEAQAENLIAEVLADDPDARILVHVGYSHAAEASVNFDRENEWFAARLKRKTGIDPLTISQTHCSLDADSAGNALDGLRLADGSEAVENPEAFDYFVAHPPMRFENGRPAWRRAIGDVEVPVPDAFLSDAGRVIIEARALDHPADEVPVDRLMVYPGETLPLLLPPGTWRLTAWTPDGALGEAVEVDVAAPALSRQVSKLADHAR